MAERGPFLGDVRRVLHYALLAVLGFVMLVPFIWMVSTSLMSEIEVYQFPPRLFPAEPKWSNYGNALSLLPFGRFFWNSIVVTLAAVLGQLLTCSMAAYAFARLRFRGRDTLFGVFLGTMMVPSIVTLIPAYLIINAFGWMNTYWALFTPILTSVWGIFLLRQFFQTLPRDYEDAARLDGAGEWTIYWRVILPLSRPALATLAVFAFMNTWKDFLWPLLVTTRNDMRTVEVGIAMFSTLHGTNWPYQMAAAVVVLAPILVLFLLTQRYFIDGISLSGLKS